MELQDLAGLLQKRLRDYMNEGADHLATGGAKDYGEYQRMVGRIDGIALAERELLDILKGEESEEGYRCPFISSAVRGEACQKSLS